MPGKKLATSSFTVTLTLAALVALLWLLGGPPAAHADPATRYVAITGNDSSNDCTDNNAPCRTVQHAVDEAGPGDAILVAAGVYSDVHGRPVPADYMAPPELDTVYQVVYITKTISIQGGHATPFTDPPDPETNPTTLDAQGGGRVVFIAGPLAGSGQAITTTIEGLRITGGDASGLYGEGGPRDAGGGVYSTDATATISNNLVFSNSAYYGGGMYLRYSIATLSDNTVTSNTAYFGGGVRLHRSDGGTVTNNRIMTNTADSGGGLVVSTSDDATVSGNTIVSNTASTGAGGGLHLQICSGSTSGNTVISNTAQEHGGGVYLYASAQMTLTNNTVAANAADDGGGLELYQSDSTLIDNIVTANTAESGGGILLYYSDATIERNIVVSNTAIGNGCGLWLRRSNATLINNVVADNQTAATTGNGLYIADGSSPRLMHNTIARNGGDQGTGVYVTTFAAYTASVAMTNTILAGHRWGIYVSPGNAATLEGTLWDNTFDWDGNGTIVTGTHNYWGDPLFDADGYHLMEGSAAIDKGVDAGVTTDIDGQPRPSDLGYEIGADEYYTLCTALTGVAITGPTEGYTDTLYTFSAVVTPSDATPPITYTWSPEPESGQGTTSARYQWTVSSTHVITLTAENCGGSDVATHTITIETPPPGCPHPLVDISITGPTTGYTGTLYTFEAIITSTGGTATPPVTYTWSPTPDVGQFGPVVTYTWTTTGTKVITATGENCGGAVKVVSDPHTIIIEARRQHIYLPLVLRSFP